MLLARMGRKSKLPRTMLMVMNQPTGMRIVFLKDRAPVLTRLIGVTTSVGEQAAEILRTLRHLENTRLLERGAQRVPMVLLGVAEQLEPLLRADRLDIVQFRIPRGYTSVSDWRHILFDRVSENPPGQVAPLVRRSTYLAAKLDKGAKIMGGLCLALALLAASPYGLTLFKSERDRLQTQAVIEQLASELANVDAALATFAVSPEALRSALAADNAEIVTAPDLEADLVQISKALTRAGGARVTKLEWRLLSPADTACTKGASDAAPLAPAAELAEGDAATEPARKVEVQLSMLEVPGAGPRLRLQQAIALTQALGEMPGASVMVDPAKRLREGDLSGGDTQADSDRQMNWCLILPGTRAGTGGPAKS